MLSAESLQLHRLCADLNRSIAIDCFPLQSVLFCRGAAIIAWPLASVGPEAGLAAGSMTHQALDAAIGLGLAVGAADAASAAQVVAMARRYFGLHLQEPIEIHELHHALGISEASLNLSFEQLRGMPPAQALLEQRLSGLFALLTDQPRQSLRRAIAACGLADTVDAVALFEQAFGIDMPLFLRTCRRAADDRLFRRDHPEPDALVLPL